MTTAKKLRAFPNWRFREMPNYRVIDTAGERTCMAIHSQHRKIRDYDFVHAADPGESDAALMTRVLLDPCIRANP